MYHPKRREEGSGNQPLFSIVGQTYGILKVVDYAGGVTEDNERKTSTWHCTCINCGAASIRKTRHILHAPPKKRCARCRGK